MYVPSYQPFFHTPFDKEVYRRRKLNYHLSLVDYYSKQDISKNYEGTCIPFAEWEYTEHEGKCCELYDYHNKKRCVVCGKNDELKPIHVTLPPEVISKILRLDSSLWFASRSVCKFVREYSLPCIYEGELLKCRDISPTQNHNTVYVVTEGSSVDVDQGGYYYKSISYVGDIDICRAVVEYKYQSHKGHEENSKSSSIFSFQFRDCYVWNFPEHYDKTEVFDIYTIEKGLRYVIETIYGCVVNEEKLNSILQATLQEYIKRYKLYPLCNALAKNSSYLNCLNETEDIQELMSNLEPPFYSYIPSKYVQPHIIV